MNKSDAVLQKLKGKTQQVTGKIQQKTGHGIKGGITEAKGKGNETLANISLKDVERDHKDDKPF